MEQIFYVRSEDVMVKIEDLKKIKFKFKTNNITQFKITGIKYTSLV